MFLSMNYFLSLFIAKISFVYIVGLAYKYVGPVVDRTETFCSFHSIVQRLFSKEAFILSYLYLYFHVYLYLHFHVYLYLYLYKCMSGGSRCLLKFMQSVAFCYSKKPQLLSQVTSA